MSTEALFPRPEAGEYKPYFDLYIDKVQGDDLLSILEAQCADFEAWGARFGGERETYRYAPGKWSVRELIGHLVDADRVFIGRAQWIARGFSGSLPGMDENEWAAASNAGERPLSGLIEEALTTRQATLAFLRGLDPGVLARCCDVEGTLFSVRAAAWLVAGHHIHHAGVLDERYGAAD